MENEFTMDELSDVVDAFSDDVDAHSAKVNELMA